MCRVYWASIDVSGKFIQLMDASIHGDIDVSWWDTSIDASIHVDIDVSFLL